MGYRWAEHVGEAELHVEAASEEAVLLDALRALGELLGDDAREPGAPEWREVTARAADRAALLAGWLEELIFLAETEGFVADGAEELRLGPDAVRARVRGRRGAPPHLVKAVTYHRLSFEPAAEGWRAVAVLDL